VTARYARVGLVKSSGPYNWPVASLALWRRAGAFCILNLAFCIEVRCLDVQSDVGLGHSWIC
jgi:hypothetical protein